MQLIIFFKAKTICTDFFSSLSSGGGLLWRCVGISLKPCYSTAEAFQTPQSSTLCDKKPITVEYLCFDFIVNSFSKSHQFVDLYCFSPASVSLSLFCFVFETGSCSIAQAGLRFTVIFQLLSPKCCIYGLAPHPAICWFLKHKYGDFIAVRVHFLIKIFAEIFLGGWILLIHL